MAIGAVPLLQNTQKYDSNATANTLALRDGGGGLTNNSETCTQFTCSGSVNLAWNPQSASYSVLYGSGKDHVIYVDTTSASATITLPAPATVGAGYLLRIVKKAATNSITISPNASETINGAASKTVSAQYTQVSLFCDGTNWIAGSMTVL